MTTSEMTKNKPQNRRYVFVVLGVISAMIVTLLAYSLISGKRKMMCNSDKGSFSITYDNTRIIDYTVDNVVLNFQEQDALLRKLGIDDYINQLSNWYYQMTGVRCYIAPQFPY